jgi:hypothetical protein
VICIITSLQAYAVPWAIPDYKSTGTVAVAEVQATGQGFLYLGILTAALIGVALTVLVVDRKKAMT